MTNNDILRRLRYIFDFNDQKIVAIMKLANHSVTRKQVTAWLKKDDDSEFQACNDRHLACFLNGLIVEKRGARDGEPPEPEKQLNNNLILLKLKIALNLRSDDIISILELADLTISPHELSAFFRRPDHKHYRQCKDQILRNFLMGLQLQLKGEPDSKPAFQWKTPKH